MTALLLAVLAGAYIKQFYPGYAALVVIAAAAYAAVEFLWTPSARRNLARFGLATAVVFLIVVAPMLLEIGLRHQTAPYQHIHDGALQTEIAMGFLLNSKNPYGADYSQTALAQWPDYIGEAASNATLYHYFYMPLSFLLPLPLYLASMAAAGWFDVRWVSLLAFLLTWVMLPALVASWERKLTLVILFGLNPLLIPFLIEGRNDIFVLLFAVGAVFALQRSKAVLGGVCIGLLVAFKATAWFLLPFFVVQCWLTLRQDRAMLWSAFGAAAVTAGACIVPFALWDARAFVNDTLTLGSNTSLIWGYGVSTMLVMVGAIPNRGAASPFWVLQLPAAAAALIGMVRMQVRYPTLAVTLAGGAVLSLVMFFFSRNFADNYLGYVVALGILAYALSERENG